MNASQPRLRMFAGPNGSGKSSIQSILRPGLLGVLVNPDEIEKQIRRQNGSLDLESYGASTTEEEVRAFFDCSGLLNKAKLLDQSAKLRFKNGKLNFSAVSINAYFASVTADFIRRKLLSSCVTFTCETVMSSDDKVELLSKAQSVGYRTYLYYVATEDPLINISRVRHRVKIGGHDVPEEKIISRYYRSLDLLMDAVQHTDRAYIFDNSGCERIWLAEVTGGKTMDIKTDKIPNWFMQSLLNKYLTRQIEGTP
ncbi:MAG: hypothetical protein HQL93_10970 [Magnetococcales bacterium]|nr:hypothetical protein [Magnetococcales bacterium]